jgi:hypothetical protein
MSESSNPLKQFFRQPAVYVKLPSRGEHWPDGSLQRTETGEHPVYPMTAIDEITYRTPDALFNGTAVVNVIQSCIPSIKNAWEMPMIDLTALLIAIRIASFGHDLELMTTCPKCENVDEFSLDLRQALDQLGLPDYSKTIKKGDVEIIFKPINYRQINAGNMEQYENQRTVAAIPVSDLPEEEKVQRMAEVMKKITELTISFLRDSIAAVRTPTALVTESQYIEEYLHQCDRHIFGQIRDTVVEFREASEMRPIKWTCTACSHDYTQPIGLDQSNFFDSAS